VRPSPGDAVYPAAKIRVLVQALRAQRGGAALGRIPPPPRHSRWVSLNAIINRYRSVAKHVSDPWKRQSRVAAEADVREWQRKQRDAPSVGGIDPLPSSSVEDRKEFATRARRYAYAAMELASGAIDEAMCAALEAWLVEHDVAQAEARGRLP